MRAAGAGVITAVWVGLELTVQEGTGMARWLGHSAVVVVVIGKVLMEAGCGDDVQLEAKCAIIHGSQK